MNLSIRIVNKDDITNVFELSNEDYVRKYSLNFKKIDWEEHVQWFDMIINSANDMFYIVTNESDDFLGQIRFRIRDNEATVSISLCKEIMGKNLSCGLLKMATMRLKKDRHEVSSVVAYLYKTNIASKKLFEKANYEYEDEKDDVLRYVYRYPQEEKSI